jgi:hypothetical protein
VRTGQRAEAERVLAAALPDEPERVSALLESWCREPGVRARAALSG